MKYGVQEKYGNDGWKTIAICESGYNADAIVLALSTRYKTTDFRSVVI